MRFLPSANTLGTIVDDVRVLNGVFVFTGVDVVFTMLFSTIFGENVTFLQGQDFHLLFFLLSIPWL